jgi:hypothetical protein
MKIQSTKRQIDLRTYKRQEYHKLNMNLAYLDCGLDQSTTVMVDEEQQKEL